MTTAEVARSTKSPKTSTATASSLNPVLIGSTSENANCLGVVSTHQFIPYGTFSDTSKSDITSEITCWGSSNATEATISKSGLVTAVGVGTRFISAGLFWVANASVVIPTVMSNNNSLVRIANFRIF